MRQNTGISETGAGVVGSASGRKRDVRAALESTKQNWEGNRTGSKEFILREIAGEHILVPIGTAAANFNGLISMNEVGRFLFDLLAEERTPQELADCVCGEYDVPPETALQDVGDFLQQLREIGALLEA